MLYVSPVQLLVPVLQVEDGSNGSVSQTFTPSVEQFVLDEQVEAPAPQICSIIERACPISGGRVLPSFIWEARMIVASNAPIPQEITNPAV
jgi:hypothetical protein